MVTSLVIIIYSLLLLITIYNLVNQYKRKKVLNGFIFFHIAFILYYIFIPIISHIFIKLNPENLKSFVLWISLTTSYDVFYAFSYTIIAYSVFMFVYRICFTPKTIQLRQGYIKDINFGGNNNLDKQITEENKVVYKFAVFAGISTLTIGIFAELLVANSLGGIFTALAMGDQLRAFGSDSSILIPQNRLFAIVLMVSTLASTYFLAYASRIKRSFIIMILFLLSICGSIFYLLINAGRLGVILFALTFFIDFAFRKSKHPIIYMFVFSIIGFILLGLLDDLFFYLSYGYIKESSSDFISFINEFAFPYLNLLNIHHINDAYGLRMGVDYFTWIINIIPTSILSLFGLAKVTSGYHFITEYYIENNTDGGIPTDILSLGMRQFGFIGVIIISTILAIICKYMDKMIDKLHSNEFYFITLRIALIMFIIIPYADLDSFVRNRYDMIMVLMFAIIVNLIRLKSKRHYLNRSTN